MVRAHDQNLQVIWTQMDHFMTGAHISTFCTRFNGSCCSTRSVIPRKNGFTKWFCYKNDTLYFKFSYYELLVPYNPIKPSRFEVYLICFYPININNKVKYFAKTNSLACQKILKRKHVHFGNSYDLSKWCIWLKSTQIR